MDGFLSFEPLYPDAYNPTLNKDIIAPLWTDIDCYTRGNISYEQATNGSLIEIATNEMNSMFSGLNFSASWVFVATWEKMEFEPDTGEVTFQVVLVSDSKNRSYVLMNYGSIPPDPLPWMAGYKTVNNTYSFSIQAPSTSSLSTTTNVGIPGRWAFQIDSGVSVAPPPALFYPFGSGVGDTLNPRSDDGSSPAINLQSPFTFFRRTYTKLYVNNNGHLTFDQPWDSYTPTQFNAYSGRDIIAPLWTDIDNRGAGTISYNQYSNGNVLSQATRDINQHFPQFIFTASWVFVATWDKVAYYSYSGTETSFQVVLISGVGFSFVLINYGDIAPTNYRVEAGYDTNFTDYSVFLWTNDTSTIPNLKYLSNVNVPGRWAFVLNQPSNTNATNSSFDPCYNYTALDDSWRDIHTNYRGHDDTRCDANVNWVGWYRLFYQGQSAKMPETCVSPNRCGTDISLWLSGSHPSLQDGVVVRQICGNLGSDCCFYKLFPIQVKACPGNYYVYEFVKPNLCNTGYCTDTSNITVTIAPTTTPQTALTTANPGYDPCSNYTVLNQPWRATNQSWYYVCDQAFEWSGWYRLLYYGMNIRMPEVCSSGCSTVISLWLNGSHPQIQDGIVTRQICGNTGGICCSSSYSTTSIRVKACPGNFSVYEFIKPVSCISAYCADITTLTPANFSTTGVITTETNITTDSSFDPCYNYTALDNYWRDIHTYYRGHDDTRVEWKGWYRLYLQGQSAQMSEWCTSYISCGGVTPLMLRGSHPQIGDGIVTREVTGSRAYDSCSYYKSNPIQVKACPGNYYVYKLVKPDISIPVPSYCAVSFRNSTIDPCYSYTALNDTWRSSTDSTTNSHCDANVNWVGWYRLFYQGQSAKMPESCVSSYRCGTMFPIWLNGSHPNVQDGVVVRQTCASQGSDCCFYKAFPIQVKACPGNYYVYEFVQPNFCYAAYCTGNGIDILA
ncbi:uncharacterized protein LOC108435028 [Pygocentrus nattereri]|uniref:uncharacterized protein LOC108435028 n=1 Tax=Pygocentrus nattereri TaxID=42514 RepID=UPI001891BCEA|nr:uncharacterized protein LOC108435028 [Pygocentrus nattereri]